ncbi:Pectinesterase 3 [Vigna angularis]|uniref:Pectinesterase 3 n=1 Tax=Phaseolus angularis TaxID=3914 RepID=A0A8T0JQ28_PHAAN|nr:Pectinesterase 3 [Vigna angularis]
MRGLRLTPLFVLSYCIVVNQDRCNILCDISCTARINIHGCISSLSAGLVGVALADGLAFAGTFPFLNTGVALWHVSFCLDDVFSCAEAILGKSNTTDPELLFKLSLRVAINELSKLSNVPSKLRANAINVCSSVIGDALDRLNDSISALGTVTGRIVSSTSVNNVET